jgi:FKBP-type peptidyl-prolyl cis-trans isomerase SlyD
MSQLIAENLVGIFHYNLTDEEGNILDSSDGQEPMPYLHGHGNIIPGLEKHLLGKKAGDAFKAVIPPAEGYGELDPEGEMKVHQRDLPKDFEYEEGRQIWVRDEEGNPSPLWMTANVGAYYTFTSNHPLAGKTLTFDVEVVGVREANEAELTHSHPHGIDGTSGHHHHH